MSKKKKITLVTSYYEYPEQFPEVQYWEDYLADVLGKAFPEHEITVFSGVSGRVLDDGGIDDLAEIEQNAWNDFCVDGYKEYTEKF